jgi:hypothetical protein
MRYARRQVSGAAVEPDDPQPAATKKVAARAQAAAPAMMRFQPMVMVPSSRVTSDRAGGRTALCGRAMLERCRDICQ